MEENKPINPTETQPGVTSPKPEFSKRFSKKTIGIIGGIIILLIILGVGTFLMLRQKPTEEGLNPPPNDVIVTVGDQLIFRSDIEAAAAEQYSPKQINTEILKKYLKILVERTILDQEAKKLGIQVDQKEMNERIADEMKSNPRKTVSIGIQNLVKYQILQTMITERVVNSRTAYVISYWTPSSSYDQNELSTQEKQTAQIQQQQGLKAMPVIEQQLRRNVVPLTAAETIIQNPQYKELSTILAMNGYIISGTKDLSVFQYPRVYTAKDGPSIGGFYYDTLFSLKKGDIKLAYGKDNATAWLIKVIEATDSQYKTYNQWLTDQIQQKVAIQTPL